MLVSQKKGVIFMPVRLINRRDVKAEARQLIRTASVSPLKFTALFLLIDLALDEVSAAVGFLWLSDLGAVSIGLPGFSLSLSFVSVLVTLLSTVLYAGYTNYCLCVQRGAAMPYDSLFDAFSFAGKVILLSVVEGILVALGFMLFVIPGVYLLFAYAFSLFYLCEDPSADVFDAMRRSREETKGYKLQLFALLFSFFPLLLLLGLAVGLCQQLVPRAAFPQTLSGELLHTFFSGLISLCGLLYIQPYLTITRAGFFRRATEERDDS